MNTEPGRHRGLRPGYETAFDEFRIQANLNSVRVGLSQLESHLKSCGLDDLLWSQVELAVAEGLNNAVEHGSLRKPEIGVLLRWRWDGTLLEVEIIDPGNFLPQPSEVKLPEDLLADAGRGFFLIHTLMDSVEHSLTSDGHKLRMTKILSERKAPATSPLPASNAQDSQALNPDADLSKTESLDLFIFADALGWKLARDRRFMEDIFPHRGPCETIFGYSCTCDPTILTGTLPEAHGHFSFFIRAHDAKASPFRWTRWLSWLPEFIARHHGIRSTASRWAALALGYTGHFHFYNIPFSRLPWLDYTEKEDIYEPGGILGGQTSIFEFWKRSGVPWVRSDWRSNDATNVARLRRALVEGKVRLAYLFTSGLDATMHAHTTQSPATDAAFNQFEGWLRDIYAVAQSHYREVRLHLFSDHGMTNTTAVTPMMLEFEELGLRYGVDYVAVWDSTMARFWFPGSKKVRERVGTWLKARSEGRIVTDAELAEWGCFFPDSRFGELFYLLNNGTIFAPSFMNQHRVPAMHGYDPAELDSAACWLTNYACPRPPRRLDGIFSIMKQAAERLQ